MVPSPVVMTPLGTFKYMAPEVLNAIAVMDDDANLRAREQIQKLDMFALGVVAYLTLGGSHPFPARSIGDLPDLIEDGPPFDELHFEHISCRAKDFCMQLMHYDSEARPTGGPGGRGEGGGGGMAVPHWRRGGRVYDSEARPTGGPGGRGEGGGWPCPIGGGGGGGGSPPPEFC